MRVFRFELKYSVLEGKYNSIITGMGPFTWYYKDYSTEAGYRALEMKTLEECQPEPEDDGIHAIKNGWAFGCDSLESLYEFFNADIQALSAAGFAVSEYEVPYQHVDIGLHQVQYYKKSAQLLAIHDVNEIFKSVLDKCTVQY